MDTAVTIGAVLSIVIGVVSYFLKRTMTDIDRHGTAISDIQKNYVKREELDEREKEIRKDIKQETGSVVAAIKDLAKEVKGVQVNYISKDDFFKENVRIEKKIDRIMDLILEDRGKRN
nr:MAG TPA: YtxH-like protein [Caudoviricetes sp.]